MDEYSHSHEIAFINIYRIRLIRDEKWNKPWGWTYTPDGGTTHAEGGTGEGEGDGGSDNGNGDGDF